MLLPSIQPPSSIIEVSGELRGAVIENRSVLLLIAKRENDFTPNQIAKQKVLVEKLLGYITVFVFDKIAAYNLKRYIEHRINFIVPHKQLFIPELLVDIRKISQSHEVDTTQIMPDAQLLVLFHLQNRSLDGCTTKEIAQMVSLPYLNTRRAINNLEHLAICTQDGGKEIVIHFKQEGRALFENVLPVLVNPVKKRCFTDLKLSYFRSSIDAMAHYTMLVEDGREHYALTKEQYRDVKARCNNIFGSNVVEV